MFANGYQVGRLERLKGGGLAFEYSTSWLNETLARPISLSLPLQSKPSLGDAVSNFFDNLLPDNLKIRQRIQAQFQTPTTQTFDLLAAIGADCIGALQLSPNPNPPSVREVRSRPISEAEIAEILNGYASYPLGLAREKDEFRISLAGAQEKTALLRLENRWHRPLGTTPTSHILKLPIGSLGNGLDLSESCENEWLCLEIAREFGFPVAKASIETFADAKALVIERFDRRWSEDNTWLIRLPQEDMCQVLGVPSNRKYEKDGGPGIEAIANKLQSSEQPIEDRERFWKTQILFWLLAAPDGHAKNFSIFIGPRGSFRLTPLYDVLSAYPLIEQGQLNPREVQLAMGCKGKNKHYKIRDLQPRHFIATAERIGITPERAWIMLQMLLEQAPEVSSKIARRLDPQFPKQISEPLLMGMVEQAEQSMKWL